MEKKKSNKSLVFLIVLAWGKSTHQALQNIEKNEEEGQSNTSVETHSIIDSEAFHRKLEEKFDIQDVDLEVADAQVKALTQHINRLKDQRSTKAVKYREKWQGNEDEDPGCKAKKEEKPK